MGAFLARVTRSLNEKQDARSPHPRAGRFETPLQSPQFSIRDYLLA